MAKILTITLNPAIDLTVGIDELMVGAVNRQQSVITHAAGKGLNVAQVLKDLGHEVVVSGFLGDENRQIFESHFAREGFDNQFVYVSGETRQNLKIAEASGRMTDINGKGFWVDDNAKTQLRAQLSAVLQSDAETGGNEVDMVIIAGSLPQGYKTKELTALIEWLKSQGKKVAVDTSGQALSAAIAASPWLIKPNTDELTETFHRPAATFREQQKLFASINQNIEHVVISMGEQGVNWLNTQQPLYAKAPHVTVKSTVGAGDSLLAGMVHGLLSDDSAEQILTQATAIASHAVTQVGFSISDFSSITDLQQQVTVHPLGQYDARY
ncbi:MULTISPECIES: 1-phosphofructokinase [unclassified Psychrobacter]|uniref:1-phosphofructokinase n=1 Tax=unclassified Psychrobacter TaxID=196806 RepID=UPI0018F63D99|nr:MULTISPECIES: 1-phosphofructokinase [unclassified Psychrobacter]